MAEPALPWWVCKGVSGSTATGVDLRLKQDGSGPAGLTCYLAWWGYDIDGSRISEVIGTLNKGVFYILSALRKSDDNVDIYLNGSLIATRPVVNLGTNPSFFQLGIGSGASGGTVTYDYVKLGQLTIPQGTLIMIQ